MQMVNHLIGKPLQVCEPHFVARKSDFWPQVLRLESENYGDLQVTHKWLLWDPMWLKTDSKLTRKRGPQSFLSHFGSLHRRSASHFWLMFGSLQFSVQRVCQGLELSGQVPVQACRTHGSPEVLQQISVPPCLSYMTTPSGTWLPESFACIATF